MKKYIIIGFLLLVKINSSAQETPKVNNALFKINILAPGLTFEKSITANKTLSLDANISLVYTTSKMTGIAKTPYVRLQLRQYYNLEKRNLNKKNIFKNSGNYYAFSSSYYFKTINDEYFVDRNDNLTIGAVWGLQRTYKNNFNININTGLGCNFSNKKDPDLYRIIPTLNVTMSWVLFSK